MYLLLPNMQSNWHCFAQLLAFDVSSPKSSLILRVTMGLRQSSAA